MLLGRLGSGGMGRVYLARSPGGRMVAVKVIRANLAEDAGFRARFAREVSAARKVGGLYTAQVVDADIDGPVPWLVTAYVPGTSLSDAVERQGPLPDNSVLALAAGLAEGLIAIHAAGVIHRDLKPSNVLLAQDGPRIIDFGISSAAEATALTGTGFMIGSPGFMSPEQAEGLTVGPASDIFSLAGVLIYAARGEGPFGSGDTAALLYRVVHGKPNIDNVPDNLRPLIKRSLSRDPKRRPTATQFLTDLSAAYPSAADLSNWLPARVLDPSAAAPAPSDRSPYPPAPSSLPGGSVVGGSVAGSVAGGSGAGRFGPAMADPVPPVPDAMAPMALAAEAVGAEPAPHSNAPVESPTRTSLSSHTPPPPTTAVPGAQSAPGYAGQQGLPGPQSPADPQGYSGPYSGQPGYPGQPGYSESQGYSGPQEYSGPQGYPGPQGYSAAAGILGTSAIPRGAGIPGWPGGPGVRPRGPGRPRGPRGPKGRRGPRRPRGPRGLRRSGRSWWFRIPGRSCRGQLVVVWPAARERAADPVPGSGDARRAWPARVRPVVCPARGAGPAAQAAAVADPRRRRGGHPGDRRRAGPGAEPGLPQDGRASSSQTPSQTATRPPWATPTVRNLLVTQLRDGDCLTGANLNLNLNTPWPKLAQAVPCSQSHTAEVFYANNNFWSKAGSYPGDTTVQKDATAACDSAFQSYVGTSYEQSMYSWADIVTDAANWTTGSRGLHCVAYYKTSRHPAGETIQGSIKGTAR